LNGYWHLSFSGQNEAIDAIVPGSVYSDLLRAGKIEDPFWRDNEVKALEVMRNDCIYSRKFTLDPEMLLSDALLLRCEGLDTLCDIKINDILVAQTDNMHRRWEFNIKNVLHAGENKIELTFQSPIEYLSKAYESSPSDGPSECMKGFSHLRKAHYMFGWDWGPRLPDAGIWRDISIISVDRALIDNIRISQKHTENRVELLFEYEITSYSRTEDMQLNISVTSPAGESFRANPDNRVTISDPLLWWPNGYGNQPLYSAEAVLSVDGAELDRWNRKIGLRALTVHREADEWGECFAHEINGIRIFAMGADYIPEDNILSRVNPARTRRLLEDCALANFNIIRCWGGGYYPDDYFYDICDELGLIIWQDFMFACTTYELSPEFETNICAEFTDNIKRLRSHACLGLWCGNNEMEWFASHRAWTQKQKTDYINIFERIIPELLKQNDPDTFYWPSSPSGGGGFNDPNSSDRGDAHYWDVWHQSKPYTEYRKYFFRYVSEFGFQSLPDKKTIDTFTQPEDQNFFSYIMDKHQRSNTGGGKIISYMAQTFHYPRDFDTLVYASQLLQAEAIRFGVEHWRRNRGRCMGAIYWQLNDCWPGISWSSIDSCGRWKALHYYAKRFFAPVLLTCEETSAFSTGSGINAETLSDYKSVGFSVVNETVKPFEGSIRWSLRHAGGEIIMEGCTAVTPECLSVSRLEKIDISFADLFENYIYYELLDKDGLVISEAASLLCPPKYFKFLDPAITYKYYGKKLIIEAKAFAKSVEVSFTDGDSVLSDNYFDMNPGSREIAILRGSGGDIRIRSVYDI